MKWKQFIQLPDYDYAGEVDRNRIRFTGIGPKVHQLNGAIKSNSRDNNFRRRSDTEKNPFKWPRDCINVEEECNKILYEELISSINNESQCAKIREFLRKLFSGLKNCNVVNLIDKFCPLPAGHFDKISFNVQHVLDCYTSYHQIFNLIHSVLRSINRNRVRQEDVYRSLFGSDRNQRIFKQNIKWLVMGNAKLKRVNAADFVKFQDIKHNSMDLTKIRWLVGLKIRDKYRVYIQVMLAITKYIQELLRRFFYITIGNPHSEMLFYYKYNLWQKLHAKTLKDLIENKVLFEFKQKDNLTKIPPLATSKLKFFLKKDGLRLIATKYKDNSNKQYELTHSVLSYVLENTPNYKRFTLNILLEGLSRFRNKLVNDKTKVYFVRADIKDCFQSIEQDILFSIVSTTLRSNIKSDSIEFFKWRCFLRKRKKPIYKMFVGSSTPGKFSKFRLVQKEESTKDIVSLDMFERDYLQPLIINPVLRESKTSKNCFNLVKGIRQGCKFSPALCSIYIQEAFNQHIGEFLNSEDCQVFHWVDDILFLSTDLEKAHVFMHKMLQGFRDFNLKMNLEKMACNFIYPNLDETVCRLEDYVIFYKQRISLDNLQCGYNYSYHKIELQYTFKVSPYCDKNSAEEVIKRARMDLIHFDVKLNGYNQVVENIFFRIALFAHRIATIFIISFKLRDVEKQRPKFLVSLVEDTAIRVYRYMSAGYKRKLISNRLNRNGIRFIAATAFLVTWRRNRLKHRSKELKKLSEYFELRKMKYLVLKPDSPSSQTIEENFDFESKVIELMKNFPESSFANEVILPSKC